MNDKSYTPFGIPNPPGLQRFGQDDDLTDNPVDRYRQQNTGGSGGGSGGRSEWTPELHLPKDAAIPVLFLKGVYPNLILQDGVPKTVEANHLRYVGHYNASAKTWPKSAICSALPYERDWSKAKELCTGCLEYLENFAFDPTKGRYAKKPEEEQNGVSRSEKRAFSVLLLTEHVRIPGTRINPKTNTPYLETRSRHEIPKQEWVKVQASATFGLRYSFSLSEGSTYEQLVGGKKVPYKGSVAYRISCNCGSCGANSSIRNNGWVCAACSGPLIDADEDLTSSEVRERLGDRAHCPHCGTTGKPVESIVCDNPVCKTPKRASIWSSVLYLRGVPTGAGRATDSKGRPQNVPITLTLDNVKPFRAEDYPKLNPEMLQPLDLARIHAPAPAARQQKVFGRLASGISSLSTETEDYGSMVNSPPPKPQVRPAPVQPSLPEMPDDDVPF